MNVTEVGNLSEQVGKSTHPRRPSVILTSNALHRGLSTSYPSQEFGHEGDAHHV